ncbi:uncharacterized protein B0H18DRAFT_879512 [Fomitopsis serialis]|uniref:uncharacterized protein n=1 Tax=Fomitopsis serialis TaxID=139415 RepID=UPI002008BD66|nr:uncharacterized protein B0H18DRAFT_879512 [Neoantrodia serialis]KAH9922223.1 hypothetical protein B0H18DRAFT_879512 [Neoantrodia serialis]
MSKRTLVSSYHYARFSVAPACADALSIRKSIQDAFTQSFGLVSANTHVDVLWVADDGSEAVVRLAESEATKLLASVTAYSGRPRLSLVKESSFLPSLLSVQPLGPT